MIGRVTTQDKPPLLPIFEFGACSQITSGLGEAMAKPHCARAGCVTPGCLGGICRSAFDERFFISLLKSHPKSQVDSTCPEPNAPAEVLATKPASTVKTGGPVATPCRTGDHLASMGDPGALTPIAGEIRISQAAIDQRMRRIMTPNGKTGEYKVSDEIVKMYKDKKGGKAKLEKLFQSVGFDPQSFITEVELFREDLLSNELIIEGEYVSEATMRDEWNWKEYLAQIIIKKKFGFLIIMMGNITTNKHQC